MNALGSGPRRGAAAVQARLGRRHQFLRYGQCLCAGHQRRDYRRLLKELAPRQEIVLATKVFGRMRPGPERPRPFARSDPGRDRQQPAPPRHRLCRPLPDPPLRSVHAGRRNDGSAERRRARRQGPLYRRILDVGLAVFQAAACRRSQRLDKVRLDAGPGEPHLSRGRTRNAAALPRSGHRRIAVEPARRRQADPSLGHRDQARHDRPLQ
jgi:hypothetical protein